MALVDGFGGQIWASNFVYVDKVQHITLYEMAEKFSLAYTHIIWEMLLRKKIASPFVTLISFWVSVRVVKNFRRLISDKLFKNLLN